MPSRSREMAGNVAAPTVEVVKTAEERRRHPHAAGVGARRRPVGRADAGARLEWLERAEKESQWKTNRGVGFHRSERRKERRRGRKQSRLDGAHCQGGGRLWEASGRRSARGQDGRRNGWGWGGGRTEWREQEQEPAISIGSRLKKKKKLFDRYRI